MRHQQPWLEREKQLLKDNWLSSSLESLSIRLNRSENAISQQAWKMKLPHRTPRDHVPKETIAFIKDSRGKITVKEMAKRLGYKPAGIYSIAVRHGFSLKP